LFFFYFSYFIVFRKISNFAEYYNLEDELPVNTKSFFKIQGSDDSYEYLHDRYIEDATGCNLGYGFGLDDDEYYY